MMNVVYVFVQEWLVVVAVKQPNGLSPEVSLLPCPDLGRLARLGSFSFTGWTSFAVCFRRQCQGESQAYGKKVKAGAWKRKGEKERRLSRQWESTSEGCMRSPHRPSQYSYFSMHALSRSLSFSPSSVFRLWPFTAHNISGDRNQSKTTSSASISRGKLKLELLLFSFLSCMPRLLI